MAEPRFVRVQHRHLSLWQSAVAETVRGQVGAEDAPVTAATVTAHPMMLAANEHVQSALRGEQPAPPAPDAADKHAIRVYLSRLGFEKGQALVDGDAERAAAIDVEFRPFSDDDPGFLTCATTFAVYWAEYDGSFKYNDWTKEGGGNINYGVIAYQLPNDAKVGVIGDWGTGLEDAKSLLVDLMTVHQPTALIHLGDIYYSGTPTECQTNYADVLTEVFDLVFGPGNRIPVFTLAGNHDYYALGYGFYDMFQALNNGFAGAEQVASYFCLRTADNGWQFVAMDSGYWDSNPADQVNPNYAGPQLQDTEVEWLRHKVSTFGGVTVLLSHHQLYSAHAKINGSASPYSDLQYLNPFLYSAFADYLATDVAAWLWGHEHNFSLYQNNLFGLAKGRLVGCSAYEEEVSSDPYAVNYPQVPYLDPNLYRLGSAQGYYNHGYAVIDLSGRAQPTDPVQISYYQFPSWYPTAPPTPASELIYSESLSQPVSPPPEPVPYGSPISLFAQEGLYVAPLYQQVQYYPTMSPEAAASLELIGRSATVSSGDELQVQTLEAAAGDYNTLGAWSTPTLYYYTPGYGQQVWQIQKRDPTDPEVHYGDEVSLVNTYYPGQYLMPYWSRVYSSIYLTSTTGDPYYWMVRPAIPV